MTIGERIKQLRDEKKVTQTELAEIAKTTKQNIYKYENGIITNIPSDKIELIAKYFKVTPSYIMGWNNNRLSAEKDKASRSDNKWEALENQLNNLTDEELTELYNYIRFLHWKKTQK